MINTLFCGYSLPFVKQVIAIPILSSFATKQNFLIAMLPLGNSLFGELSHVEKTVEMGDSGYQMKQILKYKSGIMYTYRIPLKLCTPIYVMGIKTKYGYDETLKGIYILRECYFDGTMMVEKRLGDKGRSDKNCKESSNMAQLFQTDISMVRIV